MSGLKILVCMVWPVVLVALAMGCQSPGTTPGVVTTPAERKAVAFLKREVPAWSPANGCFSCHNNGDAVRALYTAAHRGHDIPAATLRDSTDWLRHPARWDHNKGDPGFSDKGLANIQFGYALLTGFEQGQVTSRRPIREAASKIASGQDASGAWRVGPQRSLGGPTTYGDTLATANAVRVLAAAEDVTFAPALRKGESWLREVDTQSVMDAAVLLREAKRLHPNGQGEREARSVAYLRRAQTSEGGWGPYPDSPAEVFDTALALLALAQAEKSSEVNKMIERGRHFLERTQEADGGWPATTRPSGGESYAQRISTTAWATLALMASSP